MRYAIAFIFFAIALTACAMANVYVGRMVDAVNDRSNREPISSFGWHPAKSSLVRTEYSRLYSDGPLRRQARIAGIIMFVAMAACVLALGIVG